MTRRVGAGTMKEDRALFSSVERVIVAEITSVRLSAGAVILNFSVIALIQMIFVILFVMHENCIFVALEMSLIVNLLLKKRSGLDVILVDFGPHS